MLWSSLLNLFCVETVTKEENAGRSRLDVTRN